METVKLMNCDGTRIMNERMDPYNFDLSGNSSECPAEIDVFKWLFDKLPWKMMGRNCMSQ